MKKMKNIFDQIENGTMYSFMIVFFVSLMFMGINVNMGGLMSIISTIMMVMIVIIENIIYSVIKLIIENEEEEED